MQLFAATDADDIRRIAWAATEVCAVTPGPRVLKVVRDGPALRVDGATGGFAYIPSTLPGAVLSAFGGDNFAGSGTVRGHAELDAAAGMPCAWACLALPNVRIEYGIAWLLLGSPHGVHTETIVSVSNLENQVT